MKVEDLIQKLGELPPDMECVTMDYDSGRFYSLENVATVTVFPRYGGFEHVAPYRYQHSAEECDLVESFGAESHKACSPHEEEECPFREPRFNPGAHFMICGNRKAAKRPEGCIKVVAFIIT